MFIASRVLHLLSLCSCLVAHYVDYMQHKWPRRARFLSDRGTESLPRSSFTLEGMLDVWDKMNYQLDYMIIEDRDG
ncbi:hypothetical protein EV401DRAFT_1907490 [Pisolithus croceorrhizus]|nr:hypothetical protein EV401DRAFT_1907490 [Pisolithus croceorrhizus]